MKTSEKTASILPAIDSALYDASLSLISKDSEESYLAQYCAQLGEDHSGEVQDISIEDINDDLYPLLDQHIPNGLKSVFRADNIAPAAILDGAEGRCAFTQIKLPLYWLNAPYNAGKRLAAELYRACGASGATLSAHGLRVSLSNMAEDTQSLAQFMLGLDAGYAALGIPSQAGSLHVRFDQGSFNIVHFGVGLFTDETKPLSPYFTAEDQHIYVLGREHGHLGLSAYLNDAHDAQEGDAPSVTFEQEIILTRFIAQMHELGYLTACQSVSIGGIGLALGKMGIGSAIGASVGGIGNASFWYGEDQGRYIVTIKTAEMAKFEVAAQKLGISLLEIGNSEEDRLSFNNQKVKLTDLG